jgi:hypothetical protein
MAPTVRLTAADPNGGDGGRLAGEAWGRSVATRPAQLGLDFFNGYFERFLPKARGGVGKGLSLDDAGDGAGGEAGGAQDIDNTVVHGIFEGGIDHAAGDDTEEGDLFGEVSEIDGFDSGKVALVEAAGVETMLESVGVTGLGAVAPRGRRA